MDQITALQQEIQDKAAELRLLHEELGYSREMLRQLLVLAESSGHSKATAVKLAQRYLAEDQAA